MRTASMHGTYVHLNPDTGVVEPYSEEVQQILKTKPIPSDTHLGKTCFNATVHLRPDGAHYQTTPASTGPRGRGKPGGYRQIRRITGRLLSHLYKTHTPQGWRFSTSGENVSVLSSNNKVATWQWCTSTWYTAENDKWVCYESNVNDDLEEAWTNEGSDGFEVIIPVGISNKKIVVKQHHVIFRQHDVDVPQNQRCVRRVLMDISEVQRIREESSTNCPDNVCAICICSYTETSMLPRRTLSCNHTFHCACLAPIVVKRCPLCRAYFT